MPSEERARAYIEEQRPISSGLGHDEREGEGMTRSPFEDSSKQAVVGAQSLAEANSFIGAHR